MSKRKCPSIRKEAADYLKEYGIARACRNLSLRARKATQCEGGYEVMVYDTLYGDLVGIGRDADASRARWKAVLAAVRCRLDPDAL